MNVAQNKYSVRNRMNEITESDLRELVEFYRSICESVKGKDRMADPDDYQRGAIDTAELCADELEQVLDE